MFGFIPSITPYLLSLLLSMGVGIAVWQRRKKVAGAVWYALAALGQSLWTFGYIFELSVASLEGKIFWDTFQYLGQSLAAFALAFFALIFTEARRNIRPWVGASLIATLIFMPIAFLNPAQLVASNYSITAGQPFDALEYEFGLLAYLWSLVSIMPIIIAIGLLISRLFKVRAVYRTQFAIILMGILIPFVFSVLTLADIRISGQRDISPITSAIGNFIVAFGIVRFALFDLTPVARDTVIETIGDAILALDSDLRIVDANPAALRLLGQSHSRDVVGRYLSGLLPAWGASLSTPSSERDEVFHTTLSLPKDGMERHYDVNRMPLFGVNEDVVGSVLHIHDTTARVHLFERARASQAEAERANRVKSQFLATMSHELRTPLNGILNFSQFVASGMVGPVNDQQRDMLERVVQSGKHLLSLINDILDLSKIEAGALTIFAEEGVDASFEAEGVVMTGRGLLKEKPVQFLSEISPDVIVIADRRRIRQIMLNLVSNACKFTEAGEIMLRIAQEGDEMVFSIRDTGPGIKPEDQERIFEAFSQTDVGIRQGEGTGLGLAISRRLAQAHGGTLTCSSTPGAGATFTFRMPMHHAPLLQGPLEV